MKKLFFGLLLCLSLSNANAYASSGPYDGIYLFAPYGFVQVTERDGIMVAVVMYNTEFGGIWEAFMGSRLNNSARLTTVVGYVNAVIDVVINSDSNATVTIVSCVPSNIADCLFPNGTTLHGNKIW